jgi:hypothetical protein
MKSFHDTSVKISEINLDDMTFWLNVNHSDFNYIL